MTYLSVILSFRMVSVEKFIDLIGKNASVNDLKGKTREEKAYLLVKNKKAKGKLLLLYHC